MTARNKLTLISILLVFSILVVFGIWGEQFESMFSLQGSADFLKQHHAAAGWIAVGLLISDLILPVPTTGIIGGTGAVLGALQGAVYGWTGLVLAGLTGYGVAKLGGARIADKLASPEEQNRYRAWFDSWGGFAVVISRMLPILPEVFSVLAGLYGMRFSRFLVALMLGSIPPAIAYAWLGAQLRDNPGPAIWGFVGLTAAAWWVFLKLKASTT